MTVDDIPYFKYDPSPQNKDYLLAKRVEEISMKYPEDKAEFKRRLKLLASHSGKIEHQKQAGSFIYEMRTFNALHESGKDPHWIPESVVRGKPMPDIYYTSGEVKIPVEIKSIDMSQEESTFLRDGQSRPYSGGLDENYFVGITKKLDDIFRGTSQKYQSFNDNDQSWGELHLYFFPSQHVRLRDGEDGLPKMKDRIESYAAKNLPSLIKIIVHSAI